MSASNDDTPTKAELEAAAALAEQVDDLLGGELLPPAMDAEALDRVEMSSMIHSAFHPPSLDAERTNALIDAALMQGAGVQEPSNDLQAARERRRARWPVVAGGIVAAAAVALLVWRQAPVDDVQPLALAPQEMTLTVAETSRPGDREVGPIEQKHSGHASARLDSLYSGRTDGYRRLRYRKLVGARTGGAQ